MQVILARLAGKYSKHCISLQVLLWRTATSSPLRSYDGIRVGKRFHKKVNCHSSSFPSAIDEKLFNELEKDFWNAPLSQVVSDKPRESYIVEEDVSVLDAVQRMVSNNVEAFHVVSSKTPGALRLGVFNERDFIHLLASQRSSDLHRQRLKDVLSKRSHDIIGGLYESVRNSLSLMEKYKSHLIPLTMRPNQPRENITYRDCAQILSSSDLRNFLIRQVSADALRCLELVSIGEILPSLNRESRNTDHVVTVDARELVADACKRMIDREVGCLITSTWEESNPLNPYPNYNALLTQRDIIVQYLKMGDKLLAMPIGEAFSSKPVRVSSPNYTLFQVLEMLYEDDSRYSLVFSTEQGDAEDSTSRCLALVSVRDLLTHYLAMFRSI
jgi:CBS domain-containing protein